MEPLEFLGGKYHQPEQMVPGVVETFKAREKSTGRSVFVHRVSTAKDESQQAALLRLLLQALYRSPAAKQLILDYTQDGDHFYVVTESVPQCLLLREWLQFEIDNSNLGTDAPKIQTTEPLVVETPPVKTEPKVEPKPEQAPSGVGEFTRMFQAASPGASQAKPPSPAPPQPAKPEPITPKPEPVAPKPEAAPFAGEFTRMFQAQPPAATKPPREPEPPPAYQAEAVAAPPQETPKLEDLKSAGPGEFTRMFQAQAASKPTAPPTVQPPPVHPPEQFAPPPVVHPVSPAKPSEPVSAAGPGEFTRMFQANAAPPSAPLADAPPERTPVMSSKPEPPPEGGAGEFTRFFQGGLPPSANQPPQPSNFQPRQERPSNPGSQRPASGVQRPSHSPIPASAQRPTEPGEFTRMFSNPQPPSSGGDFGRRPAEINDPFAPSSSQMPGMGSSPFSAGTPAMPPPPVSKEPGEYTRMFGGGGGMPQAPVVSQVPSSLFEDSPMRASGSASAPPAAPPVVKGPSEYTRVIQGLKPAAGPAISPAPGGAPAAAAPAAAPPPAQARANPAPAASNQKLIIFLAVLGVVTVILILIVVLIALKK